MRRAPALAPLPLDAVERTRMPLEQATQLPGAAFLDPEVLAWEEDRLFAREWICAGHADQIRAQGEFFTVEVAGESVVVLADDDGLPRAFVNTCRHRGARVVAEPEGVTKRLRCPYHAWTYNLDGSLRSAPFTEGIEGFRVCDHGLHPVRLAVVEGLVLLCLSSDEAPPPEDHVGDLRTLLARYRTPELRRASRQTYMVAANWKVIAQNYNECLHCPGVHPELNRLSHYLSGAQMEGAGEWCGGSMALSEGAGTMAAKSTGVRAAIDGLTSEQAREVLYFALFPNALISLHPDYVMLHTLWPRAADRTDVVCEWFFEPRAVEAPGFDPSDAVRFWDQVNREDWAVCELTQRGMGSRSYTPGRYTTQETDVHRFDVMVADRYAAAPSIPGAS
ncbi:MAG: aromatic ring-hydroxylating dioxygenase subunit alpha [Solirubrobacteraceae bacterium]